MSMRRVVCDRHGEPFRAAWPRGYAIFMVKAFQEVVSSDEFHRETVRRFGESAPAKTIEALLDSNPLCCRLSSGRLLSLYEEAGFGALKRCKGCGRKRMGAPYRSSTPSGGECEWSHTCFRCVVYRMKPMYVN